MIAALSLTLCIVGAGLGALAYLAPRHWLISNFTSFRDIDTRGRKEVREALGIEDRIRSAGI